MGLNRRVREITKDKDQGVIEMSLKNLEFTFLGVFNNIKYRFQLYDVHYQFGRTFEGIFWNINLLTSFFISLKISGTTTRDIFMVYLAPKSIK